MVRSARICSFSWPLPAMQDDIVRLCGSESEADGGCAVGLDGVADAGGLEAGLDFGEDGERIFGAGIVAGGDDEVASLARGLAHLGALGAVAIAAAAKEGDDAATGFAQSSGAQEQ